MVRPVFAASLIGLALAASPLFAQGAPQASGDDSDKVNMVIIYGDDKCPESRGGEITVCARKPEGERYRIPEAFRNTPGRQDEAWTNRVTAYETTGAAGTQSCSPVGAGGWTGCANQFIHNAYADKKATADVVFSKMIAEARAKRDAQIDSQAAETQARVEAAEKDYDARERAKAEKAEADQAAAAAAASGQQPH